jgi:hypothetical protein
MDKGSRAASEVFTLTREYTASNPGRECPLKSPPRKSRNPSFFKTDRNGPRCVPFPLSRMLSSSQIHNKTVADLLSSAKSVALLRIIYKTVTEF